MKLIDDLKFALSRFLVNGFFAQVVRTLRQPFSQQIPTFLGSKGKLLFGAHWLYGRALGIVTLLAFISYWSQADALIGPMV